MHIGATNKHRGNTPPVKSLDTQDMYFMYIFIVLKAFRSRLFELIAENASHVSRYDMETSLARRTAHL